MNISDFAFSPHNDMDVDGQEVVKQHNKEIDKKNYSEAVNILEKTIMNTDSERRFLTAFKIKFVDFKFTC